MKRSKQAIVNFITMVLFQLLELQVDKASVALIDSKDTIHTILDEFKREKPIKQTTDLFKLYTNNRRCRLSLVDFAFHSFINQVRAEGSSQVSVSSHYPYPKDENLQMVAVASKFSIDLKNDFTKKLDRCVTIDSPSFTLHMPFSFTSDDCINGSSIFITTSSIAC